jgi:hypothetical protein
MSATYFADNYANYYDATEKTWSPFHLWPAQIHALNFIHAHPLTVILKARQLGLSWLALAYILWLMLFKPVASISIFSRRQEEADYLLGMERLKGMFYRLPIWMQFKVLVDNNRHWQLSNGSVARAFPTSAGDAYTTTFALADEFDLVEDQGSLIRAVKPTIDGGGKMLLLSKSDKSNPESEFKRIYRAAKRGEGPWRCLFLPWNVRPSRTPEWYQEQVQDSMIRTGALDDVYESYPANDAQALSPRSQDKRIPAPWLLRCWVDMPVLTKHHGPALTQLEIYREPVEGLSYRVGVDPAEGNPTSDDSSISVVEQLSGEEVASLAGKYEPDVTAAYAATLSLYYNHAPVLVERNNHGGTVILTLQRDYPDVMLLCYPGDQKPGWVTVHPSKVKLYDDATVTFRERGAILHNFTTYTQLTSIEGATLRAPRNQHDDRAISFVLALQACGLGGLDYEPSALGVGDYEDDLEHNYYGNSTAVGLPSPYGYR